MTPAEKELAINMLIKKFKLSNADAKLALTLDSAYITRYPEGRSSRVKFIQEKGIDNSEEIKKFNAILAFLGKKRSSSKRKTSVAIPPPARGSKRGQETPTKPAASVAIRDNFTISPGAGTAYFNEVVQELGLGSDWENFKPKRTKKNTSY